MKYRSRVEIMGNILTIALNGAGRTKIMYASFLSYSQLKDYLVLCSNTGLIEIKEGVCKTTEKGRKFVELFEKMDELLRLPTATDRRRPLE